MPIVWGQQDYVAAGQADKWEAQAAHGYAAGLAIALHLPCQRHLIFGIDRLQPMPADAAAVTRMTADLVLFVTCIQDVALRVLANGAEAIDVPPFTCRELEVLRWTMEGKTAWEVGNILGISEQTAARHVYHATQKLGCVNKLQAVLKAVRLGLIR